jgi:hypothetical protein
MNHFARLVVVAVGVLVTALGAVPAEAARPPLIDLRGSGPASYVLDDAGTARLGGAVAGDPFDGTYTATLAATDGSLPEPGTCETATAIVDVVGSRERHLQLSGSGSVCGEWTDATYVVTHRFVGRYEVSAATARRLRGTDGWYTLVLATEGRAHLEAIDT